MSRSHNARALMSQRPGNSSGSRIKRGGQDLRELRITNLRVLLSAIWDFGPISRFDLAQMTGLAPSSVTRLLQELAQLNLVQETGKGASSGGRQPTLIVPNPHAGLVISLDMSGPHLRGGIFDASNNLLSVFDQPFDGLGPEAIRKQVLEMIHTLSNDPEADGRPLLGIGVSLPGRVDLETGDVRQSFNLRLHDFPLRRILTGSFGLPVYIEHDASVAALAEQYYGAGRGVDYLVYILVSTGIGSGILIDGQIYRGETGQSGEFGHIVIAPGGPLCVCGQRGCLESLAAAPAMLSSARWMLTHGRAEVLGRLCGDDPDKLTIELLAQAAREADPVARNILARSADYLALAISTLASLYDIRRMIIGGEVAEAGEVFFGPLQQALPQYCREGLKLEIIPAEMKQNTFLRGISMLTLQEVLRLQVQKPRAVP